MKQFKEILHFFRWVKDMTKTLSKCKSLPTTIRVTAAQFSAYFNAGDEAEKKMFLEKINVCTGVVGESVIDTQAKKARHAQHTKVRTTLLQQALSCTIVYLQCATLLSRGRLSCNAKLNLQNFKLLCQQNRQNSTVFVICLRGMKNIDTWEFGTLRYGWRLKTLLVVAKYVFEEEERTLVDNEVDFVNAGHFNVQSYHWWHRNFSIRYRSRRS